MAQANTEQMATQDVDCSFSTTPCSTGQSAACRASSVRRPLRHISPAVAPLLRHADGNRASEPLYWLTLWSCRCLRTRAVYLVSACGHSLGSHFGRGARPADVRRRGPVRPPDTTRPDKRLGRRVRRGFLARGDRHPDEACARLVEGPRAEWPLSGEPRLRASAA